MEVGDKSMKIVKQTWINFRFNDRNIKIFIGETSKYEIETEQRNFECMSKVVKIEDLAKVKITFYELTESLLIMLKASVNSTQGVMFWDEENSARGIYQAHYFQDETKQQVILTLYQKNTQPIENAWTGSIPILGTPNNYIFGKGDFRINQFDFPIIQTVIEKNTSQQIEKFKFDGNYSYFFSDKINFKITINYLTANELSLESDGIMDYLATVKNSMVDFIPHIDKPEIVYKNLYLEYTTITEKANKKVEISLTLLPGET